MRTYIISIVLLCCLVEVCRAAPQDVDIGSVRRVRSINATSLVQDGIKISKTISSVIQKNAEAIASEISKRVSGAPKQFSANSEDEGYGPNSPPIGYHHRRGDKGPKPSPPTTAAPTTVASAR